jgi:hypothetical protein
MAQGFYRSRPIGHKLSERLRRRSGFKTHIEMPIT